MKYPKAPRAGDGSKKKKPKRSGLGGFVSSVRAKSQKQVSPWSLGARTRGR